MKKILSIDGGGIKGVFPAAFLTYLEESIEGHIWEYFDLIAGTSTGGIIALALGLGFSPREILGMYEDNAKEIFPSRRDKTGILRRRIPSLRGFLQSRFESSGLEKILRSRFQEKSLGHSKTRLLICATDVTTGGVNVFKTAHHERFKTDYKRSAKDVALATAAAPFFFKPHQMPQGDSLIDGAMWGNNPMGFAAIEGVHMLGWSPKETALLSVSCTESAPDFSKLAGTDPGAANWGLGLINCFMTSQSSASYGMAIHTLEDWDKERIKRITEIVPEDLFSLSGTQRIEQMKGLGHRKAREEVSHLGKFFEEKAEPFKPVYTV